jgi:hypothetical protein
VFRVHHSLITFALAFVGAPLQVKPITMKYAFFTLITLSVVPFIGCKSDASAEAAQQKPKSELASEIVGESVKVDPNAADIDISKSTTDVRRHESPYQKSGCTLVSDALFQQVFGVEVGKEVNVNSIPDKGHCIWTWMKPNWKEIDNANEKKGATYREFKNTMTVQVVNFGIEDAAKQQFQLVADGKKANYDTKVEGVGNEAVWSNKDHMLVARKGHLLMNLSVEASDNPADNLAKAKAILMAAAK